MQKKNDKGLGRKKVMAKKFKVKKKFGPFDRFLRRICWIVKKKPQIINLNDEEIPKKSIFIGNHNGAGGPFTLRTFMKENFMSWGAHQMTEGFRSRRKYLYHTFYRQKIGYGRIKSFLFSIGFGIFSPLPYRAAGTIPVYFDTRLRRTFEYSVKCLEEDVRVMIYPEDSNEGYKEVIEKFWPGFLQLSKIYYKKHGEDLPIYTIHYNRKPKKIVIGKPMLYRELAEKHTDSEIADIFMNYMNSLKDVTEREDAENKEKSPKPKEDK